MLERFVAKLVEQSLDELRFKNFSIIAPLSSTKIDNLCRSIFGSNQVVIDFDKDISSTDLCVLFTNGKDDGVFILKNIHKFEPQNLRYLTEVLSKRTLSLENGDDGTVELPLSECPIVLILADRNDLDYRLTGFFNFWIEISSSDLPQPMEEDDDGETEAAFEGGTHQDESKGLTDLTISEWSYAQRTPLLNSDLERIRYVIDNECIDNESAEAGYNYDGMLNVCDKYIRYVEHAFERNVLDQRLELLCRKDGPFKETLLNIYNQNAIDFERETMTEGEFVASDDAIIPFNELLNSIEINGDCREKKEFLYHIVALINDEHDTDDIQHMISDLPEDEINSLIFEKLKRACWKIKLGDEFDPSQSMNYVDDSSIEVTILLDIDDFQGVDVTEQKLSISVPSDDVETTEHLRQFADTGSHKSLCYLVYHLVAVRDKERTDSSFKYYGKSDAMIASIHNNYMLAEYKIRVESISIDGTEHRVPADCTNYEWFNLLEAFPNPGELMSITSGYGEYESALSEIDEFGNE